MNVEKSPCFSDFARHFTQDAMNERALDVGQERQTVDQTAAPVPNG
jgi:hypothetical protein